jgi:hypothetical protein
VAHDSLHIVQRSRLDGLLERGDYRVRLRVRDRLDRVSELSPEQRTEATGHFDIYGRVSVVERLVPVEPLANVLVELNGFKDFTASDGMYELLDLPDLHQLPLRAQDDKYTYYAVLTDSLPPTDRELDIVLFPRDFMVYQGSDGDITERVADFLRRITKNLVQEDTRLFGWEEYPIPVYIHDFVNEHGVDYAEAMRFAVRAWNERAGDTLGEELLRIVGRAATDPVDELVGIYYETNLGQGGILHGLTEVVVPSGGKLFETVPERVRIRYRNAYTDQQFVNRLAAHEIGHALYLDHSRGIEHIMHASIPAATQGYPHADEAYIARLIAHLPQAFDLDWIVDPEPGR